MRLFSLLCRHRPTLLQSCFRTRYFSQTISAQTSSSLRADMDAPAAGKRIHEEDDVPDPKRVKTGEDVAMPDAEETPTLSPDGEANAPSGKSEGKRRDAAGYPKSRKGKEKDTKNKGRRQRSRNEEAAQEGDAANASGDPKKPRLPKRAHALLIGFCGSGYRGMQIQQDGKTIENTLFDALVRAGAVSEDNADDPIKVGLARSARTDAGVHAAGNVVTLKMITAVPGVPDMAARINEELPPEIRLWGHVRVQNSFNPRLLCDSRKYTYFFPSYLLIPPKPTSSLYRVLTEYAAGLSPAMPSLAAGHPFWEEGADLSTEQDLERKRAWRIGPPQLEQLRASAQKYLATHNFHNFTVNGEFSDRSNQRVMKNIVIDDPVVYGKTEWMSVLFHGQSFMMHQRKMISALVLSCRTGTPPQIIDELYGPRNIFIPKMPALGLLLEQPIFDTYNAKVARANENLTIPADYRPPIDFDVHRDAIAAFKQTYIYDNMRRVEDRDGLFDAWIRMVDGYGGNDLLYLNPKGTIPPAAVIRDKNRNMAFKEKKLFDATSFPDTDVKQSLDAEEEEEEVQVDKRTRVDTEG